MSMPSSILLLHHCIINGIEYILFSFSLIVLGEYFIILLFFLPRISFLLHMYFPDIYLELFQSSLRRHWHHHRQTYYANYWMRREIFFIPLLRHTWYIFIYHLVFSLLHSFLSRRFLFFACYELYIWERRSFLSSSRVSLFFFLFADIDVITIFSLVI